MSWTLEQAANDLERYVLHGEPPSVDAAAMMVAWARMGVIDQPTCKNLATHLVDELVCSACGERVDIAYLDKDDDYHVRYCPGCGAKVVK